MLRVCLRAAGGPREDCDGDTAAVLVVGDAALSQQLAELPGPVLLVDDLVDSGWTITIVAALLREAGASGVLPLALATT